MPHRIVGRIKLNRIFGKFQNTLTFFTRLEHCPEIVVDVLVSLGVGYLNNRVGPIILQNDGGIILENKQQ